MAPSTRRAVSIAVSGYAALILCLWGGVEFLTDRVWPATLVAFGPRWLAAAPLLPLALLVVVTMPHREALRLSGVLVLSGMVLLVGFMDVRLGLGRVNGDPVLRIMTQNLGASRVTGTDLNGFMKAERIDVAALQECPFYDNDMARLGWYFYYSQDLCLVSRYPFVVLDVRGPEYVWRRGGGEPDRFDISAPNGRFQLLNVHLGTIRPGLEALRDGRSSALPRFADNREAAARESRAARARIRPGPEPIVVTGDFNLPVESAIYRAHWGNLRNAFSSCGRGLGHTKFTRLFGIRIDHVLTSDQWGCSNARIFANTYGGDHAALVVDLVSRN